MVAERRWRWRAAVPGAQQRAATRRRRGPRTIGRQPGRGARRAVGGRARASQPRLARPTGRPPRLSWGSAWLQADPRLHCPSSAPLSGQSQGMPIGEAFCVCNPHQVQNCSVCAQWPGGGGLREGLLSCVACWARALADSGRPTAVDTLGIVQTLRRIFWSGGEAVATPNSSARHPMARLSGLQVRGAPELSNSMLWVGGFNARGPGGRACATTDARHAQRR